MGDEEIRIKKVKFNLITLFISSLVLMAAAWVRQASLFGASPYGRYYLTAIQIIGCAMAAITLFRWLRFRHHRPISADDAGQDAPERQRQHYRIQFDESSTPFFVQKTDGPHAVTQFTCPVRDISETGVSLVCTGVYAHGQTVQGEVIFGSGRTAPVNGMVIREENDLTCLRLHCTIDPPLLMAEQREQIANDKGNSPRPGVRNNLMDTTTGSLPSHSPKGICRRTRR
jgi:hypothetical protein